MIIQVEGATAENVGAARRGIEDLASGWGVETVEVPAGATAAAGSARDGRDKGIDPVALVGLVLAIPSAALAVMDLADRIRKRHRAKELIDQAQELAAGQVTVCLVVRTQTVEVRGLDPDQLLELLAGDDQAG